MQNIKKNYIAAIAAVIVLAGIGYYFIYNKPASSNVPADANATTSPATTTSSDITAGNLGITATGGYTVKEIPVTSNAPKAPDYTTPIQFSASGGLNTEQKAAIEAKAVSLRAQLAKNASDYDAWLALGAVFKTAGDYAGAAKIWGYVSLAWPTDAVAPGNLGDLYMNFIKDYPKADASYLGAIRPESR